jgi:hypothetical protein
MPSNPARFAVLNEVLGKVFGKISGEATLAPSFRSSWHICRSLLHELRKAKGTDKSMIPVPLSI